AERTIAQLERMQSMPIDQAVGPAMVKVASDVDREASRDIVRDEIYPADAAYLDALRGDYLAATRKQQGIWCAPNGEQIYRTQILHWTTLQLDPREIHDSGLQDLED